MLSLKNEHRPQSHGPLTTTPDIDAQALRSLQKLIPSWAIPRDKRSPALSPQIPDLGRIPLRQALETAVEVIAHPRRIFDQVQAFDFADDGFEEDRAGGIAHPGVELTVGFVGSEGHV